MSILPILRWPDPRLSQQCAPVEDLAAVQTLVEDMFETMYAAPGRGLAAPQVGVMLRLFVMDVGWKTGDRTPLVCINPRIVRASTALATGDEACLSIPGIATAVTRPETVTLASLGADGAPRVDALSGAEAKCAQHELDHLDGLVTFDRIDPGTRARLMAEYLPA